MCSVEEKGQVLIIEYTHIHRCGAYISPPCSRSSIQWRRRTGSPESNHICLANSVVDDMDLLQHIERINDCFSIEDNNQHSCHRSKLPRGWWTTIQERGLVDI